MSDIGSATPQRDVDKFIKEALKVWEKFGFEDMSLWETFHKDFEGFTEEDFKSAITHHTRILRDYLRKFGVWIRKPQRYTTYSKYVGRYVHTIPGCPTFLFIFFFGIYLSSW